MSAAVTMSTWVTPKALFIAATRLNSSNRAALWAMDSEPTCLNPVDWPVSASNSLKTDIEYSHSRA